MNPTAADVKRATDVAHVLEQQGYFRKVKQGDDRAASYFTRLVASTVNPTGSPDDWGWLSKPAGGFNIEGYADGAMVFGSHAVDLHNVLKLVTQVGSSNPNAITIGSEVQPRRQVDLWVSPVPVPSSLGAYLLDGGSPLPIPPAPRQLEFPPRDLVGVFFAALDQKYQDRGAPNRVIGGEPLHVNNEGIFVWVSEYVRHFLTEHLDRPLRERHDAATAVVMADIDKVR